MNKVKKEKRFVKGAKKRIPRKKKVVNALNLKLMNHLHAEKVLPESAKEILKNLNIPEENVTTFKIFLK